MRDTVKVDMNATLLVPGRTDKPPQGAEVPSVGEEEEEERQRQEAEERIRREEREKEQERERQRQEAERQQRLERERAEEHRRREEARRAESEAAEKRAAEEDARRVAEEAAQREARERRATEERAQREAQEKVNTFLRVRGFKGIALPQKKCFSTRYALHAAAEENSAELVRALLACGADKRARNSSGKTALEVAQRLNKKGSHSAVVAALA